MSNSRRSQLSRGGNSHLPVPVGRGVTLRDFIVFQVKLAADGVKDIVAINLSVIAIVIDLLLWRTAQPRCFHAVVRLSERFEAWLDLHRLKGLSKRDSRRVSGYEADDLIEQFEGLVQRKATEMRTAQRDP